MLVRWIVPVVTMLVLAGQSIGAYAAAGVKTDVHCCCPDVRACKCHPEKERPRRIERCGGAVHLEPVLAVAIVLPAAPVLAEPALQPSPIEHVVVAVPAERVIEPEKPPF